MKEFANNLLCEEDESCFNEQCYGNVDFFPFSESDSEYIDMLMKRETESNSFTQHSSSINQTSCIKCTRLDIFKWTIHTTSFFGFKFGTAYLSLIYFDRFCSRTSIDDGKVWTILLLSVACLSLAAKMEENDVPALSEFRVNEYNFKGKVVQKMELLVLDTLKWNMNCASPFAYIDYFVAKLREEFMHIGTTLTRTSELILAVIEEINLAENKPSVIAAAAVLAAYDHQLTKETIETKMNAISSRGSLDKEQKSSCYNLMQETMRSRSKTPKPVISLNSLSNILSCSDVLDESAFTFLAGTKTRLEL